MKNCLYLVRNFGVNIIVKYSLFKVIEILYFFYFKYRMSKNRIKFFFNQDLFGIWLDDLYLVKDVFINKYINRFKFICTEGRFFYLDGIIFFISDMDNVKFIGFIRY